MNKLRLHGEILPQTPFCTLLCSCKSGSLHETPAHHSSWPGPWPQSVLCRHCSLVGFYLEEPLTWRKLTYLWTVQVFHPQGVSSTKEWKYHRLCQHCNAVLHLLHSFAGLRNQWQSPQVGEKSREGQDVQLLSWGRYSFACSHDLFELVTGPIQVKRKKDRKLKFNYFLYKI